MKICSETTDEPKALYQQGLAKLTGNGTTRNVQEAQNLFRRAASLDESISREVFGMPYRAEFRDHVDLLLVNWHRFAARHGCLLSMVRLGFAYKDGTGVAKKPLVALACFHYAKFQGFAPAVMAAKPLSRQVGKTQNALAERWAFQWIASGQLPVEL